MNYKQLGLISLAVIIIAGTAYIYFTRTSTKSTLSNSATVSNADYAASVAWDSRQITTPPAASSEPVPLSPPATLAPQADSGIQGTVTIGPTCPGPIRQGDESCNDKPYAAPFEVVTADGSKVVARFSSGIDGTFKVSVVPGTYTVRPAAQTANIRSPRVGDYTVVVKAHLYSRLDIQFDSGIR